MMKILDPISLPLNSVCLIEASAGTGKTYTMTSLYLRLLLQAGQNCFPQPLTVEQILVVTFTEAATQELKKRIRERIHFAKQAFQQYLQTQDPQLFAQDKLLQELLSSLGIEGLPLAIQRLNLAEQNLDMAAIYTIHSFCYRMLMQYAFNSGIHFNLELVANESKLLLRLIKQCWRDHFYSLSLPLTEFVQKVLGSPEQVKKNFSSYITGKVLQAKLDDQSLLTMPLTDFFTYIEQQLQQIKQFKQQWLDAHQEIEALIIAELEAKNKKPINQRLKRTTFNKKRVADWLEKMKVWAESEDCLTVPDVLGKYFCQQALNNLKGEEAEPFSHFIFEQGDKIAAIAQQFELYARLIQLKFIQVTRAQLMEYKLNHNNKNFDDLLRLLWEALYDQKQGQQLAEFIRQQYPFTMIDEFQDTDQQQYEIFSRLYLEESPNNYGFIMIGDPKQAIYRFRGADIFTYLKAASQAKHRFSLATNYRSEQSLVQVVNQLFDFKTAQPFVYQDKNQEQNITFEPVQAHQTDKFELYQQPQPALKVVLHPELNDEQCARYCAISIQQWLKAKERNQAMLGNKTLENQDIAVLVSAGYEAQLIKKELSRLGIASVYLSDRGNLFECREARELPLILRACLNPLSESNLLNAIATGIFALTAAEIQQIKQNELLWESWVNRFVDYQTRWRQQGILVMLHHLFLENRIPEKLLTLNDGERRVTDLLHLSEALQQADKVNESEDALLRWLEYQIQDHDEQRIRLESESQLVKIVTIHKSKGLQYGLVWLPFVAKASRVFNKNGSKKADISLFQDEDKQQYWDIQNQYHSLAIKEKLAEYMRLLYVALTRAKFQIAMNLPTEFPNKWNPLLYALTKGEIGVSGEVEKCYSSTDLLAPFAPNIEILKEQDLVADDWRPTVVYEQNLVAAQFEGKIEQYWQVASFTTLSQRNEWLHRAIKANQMQIIPEYQLAQDYDISTVSNINVLPATVQTSPEEKNYLSLFSAQRTPFDFPHGINVGRAFHRYFEKSDFSHINEEELNKLCLSLSLDETWINDCRHWINLILQSPLSTNTGASFCLAEIKNETSIKEMQFYLGLSHKFNLVQFNPLLKQYHHLKRADFLFEQIQGVVRGFIDLVVEHQGKYYLIDYKTNFLGDKIQDYDIEQLEVEICRSNYDLQYLLYSLALHRYLSQRIPDYQYQTHFGGVFYCFLRGMNGENNQGVFFDKPEMALIDGLDRLF